MKSEQWNGRAIRFIEKDGEWWAVLKDISDALDIRNDGTKKRLRDDHISNGVVEDSKGRKQTMCLVDEIGIYDAVFHSRKKESDDFRYWVYGVLKELRSDTGLQGFDVFRMLDKEHQKEAMQKLRDSLNAPEKIDYIKANTVTDKAVSNLYGLKKMVKKRDMSADMLQDREPILNDVVSLMGLNDRYHLGLSISKAIGKRTEGKQINDRI